jgi:hypothetical protein
VLQWFWGLLTFTQDEAQPDEATSLVAVVGITGMSNHVQQ